MAYTVNSGTAVSKDLENYKKAVTLEEIDIRIPEEMDFSGAVITQNTDKLDIYFQMPKESVLPVFKIDEGQTVIRQKMGWFETGVSLYGYRGAIEISDVAKVRGDYGMQWRSSIDGVTNGFVEARDSEIIHALYNGAGNTVTATEEWSDVSGKDIITDVGAAVRKIFHNKRSNIRTSELNNLKIYYPAKLIMDIDVPEQFQNGTSGAMGYLIPNESQTSFLRGRNIEFIPTSRLNEETFAIGVMPSVKCAVQYVYNGTAMPRVEEYRDIEEGAEGYMMSQWFRTKITPQSSAQRTTSDRVFLINGVATADET